MLPCDAVPRVCVDGSAQIHYNDLLNTSNIQKNRVGLGDAVIMGLSSSGPSQTLAVSLAGLVAVSGYGGVVPILICFVPMIGIALAGLLIFRP